MCDFIRRFLPLKQTNKCKTSISFASFLCPCNQTIQLYFHRKVLNLKWAVICVFCSQSVCQIVLHFVLDILLSNNMRTGHICKSINSLTSLVMGSKLVSFVQVLSSRLKCLYALKIPHAHNFAHFIFRYTEKGYACLNGK